MPTTMSILGANTNSEEATGNDVEASQEENGERIKTAELESRAWPENKSHNNQEMDDKAGAKDEDSKMAADEATNKELWLESDLQQENAKRIANSDIVLLLGSSPLMHLNPLGRINSSQEQLTPAREDEGDAAHRNQTFLLGCSVSTIKEMTECSRKLNQSPVKIARGKTFIAMSDANISTIMEQCTVLSPRGAVDVSSLLENNVNLAKELLDAFHKYTSAGPEADVATDGMLASGTSLLPDVMAAARPMEVTSEAAATERPNEEETFPEPIVTIVSETEEPFVEAELAEFTVTEMLTDFAREDMQKLMVEAAELVDGYFTLEVTVPAVPCEVAAAERVVGEMKTEGVLEERATKDVVGEFTIEYENIVDGMETEVMTPYRSAIVEKEASKREADMTADVEFPTRNGMGGMSSAVLTLEDNESIPPTSQEDILVTSEMNVESPPELNLPIPSELAETMVVSVEEKLIVSKTTDAVVIEMDVVSQVIHAAMPPVTPESVELSTPDIEAPFASYLMESVTPNVVAPIALEVVFTVPEIETPVASGITESVTIDVLAPIAREMVFTAPEIEMPHASIVMESATLEVVEPVVSEDVFTAPKIETPLAPDLTESVTPNIKEPVVSEVVFTAPEIETPVASIVIESATAEDVEPVVSEDVFTAPKTETSLAPELTESVTPNIKEPVVPEVVFTAPEIETPVASVLMESFSADVMAPFAWELELPATYINTPVATVLMESVTPDAVAPVVSEMVSPVSNIDTPIATYEMESVTPDVVEPVVSEIVFVAPDIATPIPTDLVSEHTFTAPEMETSVPSIVIESETLEVVEPVVSEVVFTTQEMETPVASDMPESVTPDVVDPIISEVVTPDESEIEAGMAKFNAAVIREMNKTVKPQGIMDATPEPYVSLPEVTMDTSTEPTQKAKKISKNTKDSTKKVTKATAPKRPKTVDQLDTAKGSKKKRSADSSEQTSTELLDTTETLQDIKDTSVSLEVTSDAVAATGDKDQLDSKQESDKPIEEQTSDRIKDIRKRRRIGVDAAESKRQKTASSQQPDAVQ